MHEKPPSIESEKSFLDNWIETEFNREYDEQARILQKLQLMDLLPDSEKMGIRGIDGNEYPLPSKKDIIAEIKRDPGKYEMKIKRGFTKIQFTPFALPLERLIMVLEYELLDHHKRGKLFRPKENPNDPDVAVDLDSTMPIDIWSDIIDRNDPEGKRGADVTNRCLYHITSFSQKHGGRTKIKILKTQNNSPFSGWEIKLLAPNPNKPKKWFKTDNLFDRVTASGKIDIPLDFLKLLQDKTQYRHEQGLTLEDWLTEFLVHLEQTNQVINDDVKGNQCPLIGSFYPERNSVCRGSWGSRSSKAHIGLLRANDSNKYKYFRHTAVPVDPKL
ncbi:MAG: hypothetical protein AAB575_00520 [Patescibacteria group bacterium]